MSVSMKNLVRKDVARTVRKKVEIKPDQVADLLKKAVGAPEEIPLNTTTAADGSIAYVLEWTETPKPRAPRKAKEAPAPVQDGEQA